MNNKLLYSYYLKIKKTKTFKLQQINIIKLFTPQQILNNSFTTNKHNHNKKLNQNNKKNIYLQKSPTPYNNNHKYTLLNKITFKYSYNT